jgi:hypothetical protein
MTPIQTTDATIAALREPTESTSASDAHTGEVIPAKRGSRRPWSPAATELASADLSVVEALFVQTARKFTSDGSTITLGGLTPTLYFASRPSREVGQLPTVDFVALWTQGADSFAADPPEAVLSFFDRLLQPDEIPPDDVTVVLRQPVMLGDALTYSIDVVEGSVPAETGGCSVFIDATRPALAPIAAAYVRRCSLGESSTR